MRLYMCLRVAVGSLWLERWAFGRKAQSPPFGLQAGVLTAFPPPGCSSSSWDSIILPFQWQVCCLASMQLLAQSTFLCQYSTKTMPLNALDIGGVGRSQAKITSYYSFFKAIDRNRYAVMGPSQKWSKEKGLTYFHVFCCFNCYQQRRRG